AVRQPGGEYAHTAVEVPGGRSRGRIGPFGDEVGIAFGRTSMGLPEPGSRHVPTAPRHVLDGAAGPLDHPFVARGMRGGAAGHGATPLPIRSVGRRSLRARPAYGFRPGTPPP